MYIHFSLNSIPSKMMEESCDPWQYSDEEIGRVEGLRFSQLFTSLDLG